jgi:hypothetical protein
MTEATEQKQAPMSKADLMVSMSILLDQYESHPDNKDSLSLQMRFFDERGWEYVWADGKFDTDYPDIPGDDN